jgi:hypothetical protein
MQYVAPMHHAKFAGLMDRILITMPSCRWSVISRKTTETNYSRSSPQLLQSTKSSVTHPRPAVRSRQWLENPYRCSYVFLPIGIYCHRKSVENHPHRFGAPALTPSKSMPWSMTPPALSLHRRVLIVPASSTKERCKSTCFLPRFALVVPSRQVYEPSSFVITMALQGPEDKRC